MPSGGNTVSVTQIYRRSFQDSNGDGNCTRAVPGNHTASQNHRQASMSQSVYMLQVNTQGAAPG
jgi:hypothetical protein